MTPLDAALILLAGTAAGAINALVGAGTLITFSTLVTLGVPPLVANVSNTVGLVAGSVTGSWGYREYLTDQGPRLRVLLPASVAGGVVGALLLLVLPPAAFRAIVPVLILGSVVLVVLQPRIQRAVAAQQELESKHRDPAPGAETPAADGTTSAASQGGRARVGGGTWFAVLGAGVYGGYFGAAQGVLLIGILGTWLDHDLQRVNAIKNVLAGAVNAVAAVLFIALADVNWAIAGLLLVGSTLGGWLGAGIGTRLPRPVLRAVIVVVGLVAVVVLATR
jgi:uncharacterized membrane protein YfcA